MEEKAGPLVREEVSQRSGEKRLKVYQRTKRRGIKRTIKNHASGSGFSPFDDSVENHFRAMDKISALCGEDAGPVEEEEMKSLSEMLDFLTEWRYFNYKPRTIRFAYETGVSQGKDVLNEISLSQFSSATVPKAEDLSDQANSIQSRNDFVFYAGGSVWALDWCPRPDLKPDSRVSCEFIAVSAHPPDSSYHKLGARLSGRGMVQIWCVVNQRVEEEDLSSVLKQCPKSQKRNAGKKDDTLPKRPRGRPRKPVIAKPASLDFEQPVEVLAIEYPESSSTIASVAKVDDAQPKRPRGKSRNQATETASTNLHCQSQSVEVLAIECPGSSSNINLVDENLVYSSSSKAQPKSSSQKRKWNSGKSEEVSGLSVGHAGSEPISVGSSPIPKEILPPRLVLCLGHNGKVAWDVKWRPSSTCYSECKHRLGHLAVLLGDGSLEVWEIPSPRILKALYLTQKQDRIDPRFVKLKPVFRCLKLRCGARQSIPLTVEWSTSPPHDLILAGCHDGMVALWKFSATSSPKDSRPILCFSADTLPIRALAWAPSQGDTESGNIIVTAAHEAIKYWDLRDPFRPLWDIPVQRFVYSLDWLPDPRCILTTYDDGALRIQSLAKAAYDVPATGKPFSGTALQGIYAYSCSRFTIWSIHVSRHTGMVAYCGSNGTVFYFQLTHKAVDKDPHRNRVPHFLCGSLTDEDGILVVNTPLSPICFTPRSLRGLINDTNKEKREKEQNLDDQHLALDCDEDTMDDDDMDRPISFLKNAKSKTSKTKKAKEGQGSASKDVDPESSKVKKYVKLKTETVTDTFPSKMVALHRVRWNLNKGSQRWLCYGGASGIVRCQEVIPPVLGKKFTHNETLGLLL